MLEVLEWAVFDRFDKSPVEGLIIGFLFLVAGIVVLRDFIGILAVSASITEFLENAGGRPITNLWQRSLRMAYVLAMLLFMGWGFIGGIANVAYNLDRI